MDGDAIGLTRGDLTLASNVLMAADDDADIPWLKDPQPWLSLVENGFAQWI